MAFEQREQAVACFFEKWALDCAGVLGDAAVDAVCDTCFEAWLGISLCWIGISEVRIGGYLWVPARPNHVLQLSCPGPESLYAVRRERTLKSKYNRNAEVK